MPNRRLNIVLMAVLVVLGAIALQPYIERHFYAATVARPIEARGNLADYEQSAIALFERVSPSVVQVVGRSGNNRVSPSGDDDTGVRTGTGFVWDGAGDIVTNNHVVEGSGVLAVRLSSGEAVKASIVGTAPNYDLAVIRVTNGKLPPAISVGSSADLKVGQAVRDRQPVRARSVAH